MQYDQIRLILNVVFKCWVLIVIKKKGYKIKKDIINTVKNHVFQMGANMRLIVFKGVKIQILEISYEV
jgi:hypothetical protein